MTATNKELQQVPEVTIAQTGEQYIADQALMEEMLQQLSDKRKEIHTLSCKTNIISGHLFRMLDEHEAIFDLQKGFESLEFASDYIEAASAAKAIGRTGDRLDAVNEWMQEQETGVKKSNALFDNFKNIKF